jgi:hypothetical protein
MLRFRKSALGAFAATLMLMLAVAPVLATSTVVWPGGMGFWAFTHENTAGGSGAMVAGPGSPPQGTGSAELTLSASDQGYVLAASANLTGGTPLPGGTPLGDITALSYSTYRSSADAGNNLAVALQFSIDYDLTDGFTGWQGRLVYEPYRASPGGVLQDTWQTWDTLAGKWWQSGNATVGGSSIGQPCGQSSPCTWAQILSTFPNAGVNSSDAQFVLKAGSGWSSFTGNVDNVTVGINGTAVTYDFELDAPPPPQPATKADCMKGGFAAYGFKNQGLCIQYFNTGKDSR